MLKVDSLLIQFLHKLQIPQSQISLLICKPVYSVPRKQLLQACGWARLLQEWSGTSVGRSSPGRDWKSTRFQAGGQGAGSRAGQSTFLSAAQGLGQFRSTSVHSTPSFCPLRFSGPCFPAHLLLPSAECFQSATAHFSQT